MRLDEVQNKGYSQKFIMVKLFQLLLLRRMK